MLGDHAMLFTRKRSRQIVLVPFRGCHDDAYLAGVGGETSHRVIDLSSRLVRSIRCEEPRASGERERETRGEWTNRLQPLYKMTHVHPRLPPWRVRWMEGKLRA